MAERLESLTGEDELARMRQAQIDHPETRHTRAGGGCRHCGCGNDVLGYKHLPSCNRPKLLSQE